MKHWKKIVFALALAGIVGGWLAYEFVYNKAHPNFENEPAVYSLTAVELFSACRVNAQAAAEKYNGKVIEISGRISEVEMVDSLAIVVFAIDNGLFGAEGIRVSMLSKYNVMLQKQTAGDLLKLKGFCSGYNGTDVIIEQGSIVNN